MKQYFLEKSQTERLFDFLSPKINTLFWFAPLDRRSLKSTFRQPDFVKKTTALFRNVKRSQRIEDSSRNLSMKYSDYIIVSFLAPSLLWKNRIIKTVNGKWLLIENYNHYFLASST